MGYIRIKKRFEQEKEHIPLAPSIAKSAQRKEEKEPLMRALGIALLRGTIVSAAARYSLVGFMTVKNM